MAGYVAIKLRSTKREPSILTSEEKLFVNLLFSMEADNQADSVQMTQWTEMISHGSLYEVKDEVGK